MSQRAEVARLITLAALAGGYAAASEVGFGRAPRLGAARRELEAALRMCDGNLDADVEFVQVHDDPGGLVDRLWSAAQEKARELAGPSS